MNIPCDTPLGGQPTLAIAEARYKAGDYPQALHLFRQLAEGGDSTAQMWVGACLAGGQGAPASLSQAFEWYLQAAHGGHSQAQTNVGAMLLMGQGCEVDVATGLDWLERAAAADCGAQFNLAALYSKGEQVEQDHAKAAYWYRRAAEQGHYPSQARLGYLYLQGQGVSKDRVEAFAWLSMAAQHGVGTALVQLERVIELMSTEEKQCGMELVEQRRQRLGDAGSSARLQPIPG
ncbi:tetratricopeptide repeat protein [Stutzerimonas stutzeri]|jgi:uncharacterized protein|uniref:tetratricopeptide repeat protein n=1 Tax=Pseudomonadaceae TaxID=135621 RepID=UPI000FD32722|nr:MULTISPECIES: tetratricopeptide repeat protein [Pseudomonadaceae]RUI10439.1 sel1 repeat family protein [Pseudomonas aeruginosa]UIP31941.1 sel1 repeat family protein [Stutzerimonas kunmingensis]